MLGVEAQLFVDAQDISTRLSGFRWEMVSGNVDKTRLRAPGNYRQHLVTLLGGTIGFTGDMPEDQAEALEAFQRYIEGKRTPFTVMACPYGAEVGYLAMLGHSLRAGATMDTETEGVMSLNADFEMTQGSPGVRFGKVLFTPNAATTVDLRERWQLRFINANVNQFFAFRAKDTVEIAEFQLGSYASDAALRSGVKTLLEGLEAYDGKAVTVSTLEALSGTTEKSALLLLEWSDNSNLPNLEVLSGPVRELNVSGGDTGDYAWNGGDEFELGITEANLQANQREIGGQHVNVVVKGASSKPAIGYNLLAGGTASSTPSSSADIDYPASNAVDGDNDSLWVSTATPYPIYWIYDRGVNAPAVNAIRLELFNKLEPNGFIRDFTVETSADNNSWSSLGTFTDIDNTQTVQNLPLTGIVHRYVRISVTDINDGSNTFTSAIAEMKLIGGGDDWTTGLSFSNRPAFTDDDNGTDGTLEDTTSSSIIDLGQSRSIVAINFRGYMQSGDPANTMYIEGSNSSNMSSAVTLISKTGAELTGSLKYNSWSSLSTTPYRYIRIRHQGNSNQLVVNEIELRGFGGAGTANYKAYYPVTATPAATVATGAGATATEIIEGRSIAAAIASTVTQEGGTMESVNVVSAPVNGPRVIDSLVSTTTNQGLIVVVQPKHVSIGGTSDWVIQRETSANNWSDVIAFTISSETAQYLEFHSGANIQANLRARCTSITGDCVVAIAAARKY